MMDKNEAKESNSVDPVVVTPAVAPEKVDVQLPPKPDKPRNAFSFNEKINRSIFRRKKIISILFIASVLLIAGAVFYLKPGALFAQGRIVVGDTTYSGKQVNDYLIYPVNVLKYKKADAKKRLIELLVKEEASKKLGISPSALDLRLAYQRTGQKQSTDNKWVKLAAYSVALDISLERSQNTQKSGYLYVFYFGNYLIPNPFEPNIPGFGDQAKIDKDKAYAKAQVDKYYGLLKDKKIDPNKALAEVVADNTIAVGAVPGSNFSRKFGNNPDVSWANQVGNDALQKAIKAQTTNGLSAKVQTAKVAIKEDPQTDQDYKDAMYYFFILEGSNDLANKLSEAIKQVKVKQ